jgi:hypothetical protein
MTSVRGGPSDGVLVWNGLVVGAPGPRANDTARTRDVTLEARSARSPWVSQGGTEAAEKEVRMHARIARYSFTGSAEELSRKAEEGMLPILQSAPGFKAYTVIQTDDEIIAFSGWETAEAAEAANATIASWVADNVSDRVQLKEIHIGEILISTALGVSTKAGITA